MATQQFKQYFLSLTYNKADSTCEADHFYFSVKGVVESREKEPKIQKWIEDRIQQKQLSHMTQEARKLTKKF